MALLHDIQRAVVSDGGEVGPVLMKLRLLAARLGSVPLEDWVRHESEGYPADAAVPDYRKVDVSHTASFHGPFGGGCNNAPIPPYLVAKYAGKEWVTLELRQSVASIDELLGDDDSGVVTLDRSD